MEDGETSQQVFDPAHWLISYYYYELINLRDTGLYTCMHAHWCMVELINISWSLLFFETFLQLCFSDISLERIRRLPLPIGLNLGNTDSLLKEINDTLFPRKKEKKSPTLYTSKRFSGYYYATLLSIGAYSVWSISITILYININACRWLIKLVSF